MSRAIVRLVSSRARAQAAQWLANAPDGVVVTFQRDTRSTEQNSRMWAMLTDIAQQLRHHGQKYDPPVWKELFMHALNGEMMIPGLDKGFISLGRSTSKLTKDEMSALMELIAAYGAKHGVVFHDDQKEPASC